MPNWTPSNLAVAPHSWHDVSNTGSLTLSGALVEQVNDLSGNGRHLTATGSNRPTYSATGLGGSLPGILGATDQGVVTPSGSDYGLDGANFTTFTAFRNLGGGNYYDRILSMFNGSSDYSNNEGFHIFSFPGTESAFGAAAQWNDFAVVYVQPINTNYVVSVSGGSLFNFWLNGTMATNIQNYTPNLNVTRIGLLASPIYEDGEGTVNVWAENIILGYIPTTDERQRIEGYLAWKWNSVDGLPSDHPYKTAAPTWTPAALGTKLLGWLRADDAASLDVTSGNVENWRDQVGTRTFTEATVRPAYDATGGPNGTPAVVFDGTEYLTLDSVPYPTGTSAGRIYAVCSQERVAASDTVQGRIFQYGDNTGASSRGIGRRVTSGTNRFKNSTGTSELAVSSVDFSGWHWVMGGWDGSGNITATIDGVSATPAAVSVSSGTTRTRIGSNAGSSPGEQWLGKISHVIITTNDLTTAEEDALEYWLTKQATEGVAFIGQSSGENSATLPTHASGDLIVCFGYRDGSSTLFAVPSGWTTLDHQQGQSLAHNGGLFYKIATSSLETSGTWTDATAVVFHVYSGAEIGSWVQTAGTTLGVNFPALTFSVADGTSWAAGFIGYRQDNTNLETPPTGMVNRSNYSNTTISSEASGHDTNGGVTGWASTNQTLTGSSGGWITYVLELKATVSSSGSEFLTDGQSSMTFVGNAIHTGVLSSAGVAALTGIGGGTASAILTSAGIAVLTGVGSGTASSVLSSIAAATTDLIGRANATATITSAGAGALSLTGASSAIAILVAAGETLSDLDALSIAESVLTSNGLANVTFMGPDAATEGSYQIESQSSTNLVGSANVLGVFSITGGGATSFVGQAIVNSTLTSNGGATGSFDGSALATTELTSQGITAIDLQATGQAISALTSGGQAVVAFDGSGQAISSFATAGEAIGSFSGGARVTSAFMSNGRAILVIQAYTEGDTGSGDQGTYTNEDDLYIGIRL